MRAPVRAVRGGWPAAWERRAPRLFRTDPRVLLEEDPSAEDFRAVMSIIHVGETIKITQADRHAPADALLRDHLDLAGATVVDIGASDGSTSVDLVAKLPDLGSYVIADLYLELSAVEVGRHVVLFDPHGTCVLVAGRRLVGWPSLSRVVRVLAAPLVARARRRPARPVLLLGPAARRLVREDPRVTTRVHDVFQPWTGPAPDVVKVANLLRRLYFGDEDIRRALRVLFAGLPEGGHLLVVDNPRVPGIDVRGGLYRRSGDCFVPVAQTEHPPEIADLIASPELVRG
ncbi:hypothetical protein [Geodermatophilus sp. DSM 45219]|uniref:hypothetical protein n=1 Tax=Geodermatophilus sp. DSM 45219 TaxID=1881103 RepID=UPI000889A9F3|nr:hypothetical protein [Geodermatophilus sp. DSM 45219]SDN44667.1 hypothetical protein SAMN05428965_0428 [Geodermatophilus sp. DSM 45219]